MTSTAPARLLLIHAAMDREWQSHRANRFLYWHVGLLVVIGLFAVSIAPADDERGVAWFILSGVLYVLSLSSLLLGLNSAQAEREELPFLATQPSGLPLWLAGKVIGLVTIVFPTALLLIVPWLILSGWSWSLLLLALGTGGLCTVFTFIGLAVGLRVSDPVRGLLVALAGWFFLLFAVDFAMLLLAGVPWIRENPDLWALPLMLNPLDAFRIAVVLEVDQAAFTPLGAQGIVAWWSGHAALWLGLCLGLWAVGTLASSHRALRKVQEND